MIHKVEMTGMKERKSQSQKALESAFATSFRVLKLVMFLVIIMLLFSGVFKVKQNEKAVVLRFGKIAAVLGPGLHFALPYPIDEIYRIPTGELKSIEVEKIFWHQEVKESSRALPLMPSLEYGYTLTSDANIIHSKWLVLYRINDPVKYLFMIEDGESLLSEELQNAIVEASSEYSVDETTRAGKAEFSRTVEWLFNRNLKEVGCGDVFDIKTVKLEGVKPPSQTRKAFENVINAEQDRDNKISEARGEADSILNSAGGVVAVQLVVAIDRYRKSLERGDEEEIIKAKQQVDLLLSQAGGKVSQIITQAEAYRKLIVTEAESDAKRIYELRKRYRENPEILITEKLFELYMELFKEREVYLLTETTAKGGRELRILINPDPDVKREERHKKLLEELE